MLQWPDSEQVLWTLPEHQVLETLWSRATARLSAWSTNLWSHRIPPLRHSHSLRLAHSPQFRMHGPWKSSQNSCFTPALLQGRWDTRSQTRLRIEKPRPWGVHLPQSGHHPVLLLGLYESPARPHRQESTLARRRNEHIGRYSSITDEIWSGTFQDNPESKSPCRVA